MDRVKESATAGPWRVGDAGRTVFGPPNGNPAPKVIAAGLSRADARLIAAAPALLARLTGLLSYLSDIGRYDSGSLFDINAPECCAARGAVRQAKGGC